MRKLCNLETELAQREEEEEKRRLLEKSTPTKRPSTFANISVDKRFINHRRRMNRYSEMSMSGWFGKSCCRTSPNSVSSPQLLEIESDSSSSISSTCSSSENSSDAMLSSTNLSNGELATTIDSVECCSGTRCSDDSLASSSNNCSHSSTPDPLRCIPPKRLPSQCSSSESFLHKYSSTSSINKTSLPSSPFPPMIHTESFNSCQSSQISSNLLSSSFPAKSIDRHQSSPRPPPTECWNNNPVRHPHPSCPFDHVPHNHSIKNNPETHKATMSRRRLRKKDESKGGSKKRRKSTSNEKYSNERIPNEQIPRFVNIERSNPTAGQSLNVVLPKSGKVLDNGFERPMRRKGPTICLFKYSCWYQDERRADVPDLAVDS